MTKIIIGVVVLGSLVFLGGIGIKIVDIWNRGEPGPAIMIGGLLIIAGALISYLVSTTSR